MAESVPNTLPCGDATLMGRLFAQLEPKLRSVALRMVHDPDAAADVVQNAFEKALRHCKQFQGTARPSTWMHRIVVNEALQWLRSRSRRTPARIQASDWELVFCRPETPDDGAATLEQRGRIDRALASLDDADRALLIASVVEGRSFPSLQASFHASAATLKTRAFRARRKLALELERNRPPLRRR